MYRYDLVEWLLVVAMALIIVVVMAIVVAAIAGSQENKKAQEVFMELCQQDKKEYECMAKWRNGSK